MGREEDGCQPLAVVFSRSCSVAAISERPFLVADSESLFAWGALVTSQALPAQQ